MDSNDAKIIVRPAELADKEFILTSWMHGNYYGYNYFRNMPPAAYYENYSAYIKSILCDPKTIIDVACDSSLTSFTYGFAVYQSPILFWVFVKPAFRDRGVATMLLKDKGITTTTSITKPGHAISRKKGLIFNPFAKGE